MIKIFAGLIALFLINSGNAAGLLGFGPDATELKSMPDYCQASAKGPQAPEFQYWSDKLGKPFSGFHHYCAGVNQMHRYQRLLKDPKRNYYLSRAVPEMNYVMDKLPPDFPLAGEMYLNRGLAKQLMKLNAAAMSDFQTALNHNPKLAQAYIGISEFHEKANQKQKALDLITKGLIEVPDSKALKRKYLQLGGKEPLPAAKTEPEKTELTNAELTKTEHITTTEQSESKISVDNTTSLKAVETAKNTAKESSNNNTDTKTNTKNNADNKNPYCRFCP